MTPTGDAPLPPEETSGRFWRRRDRAEGTPLPPLSLEELQAHIVELTAAAERAASLRNSAELAAAEQAAERLVAEEHAGAASRALTEAERSAEDHARAAADACSTPDPDLHRLV
ncbi:hypothetical protein, partial [Nocardioides kribbensis]